MVKVCYREKVNVTNASPEKALTNKKKGMIYKGLLFHNSDNTKGVIIPREILMI